MVPSFTTEAAIYAKYLQEHKPDAKVAMLYLNTDFGNNFLDGFKAAIKGHQDPAGRRRSRTPTPIRPSTRSSPT